MNAESLIQSLQWRYAVKKFDSSKIIDPQAWKTLEESLILTPSSYGLQPWNFHVITSKELKAKLMEKSWKQTQVADCSHLVVFATKTNVDENYIQMYIDSVVTQRALDPQTLEGFKKVMISDLVKGSRSTWVKEWAARQAYIALGNFMTSAAVLHIDTCPLEGIIASEYDNLLNLTQSGYQTVVACAAGYRHQEDKYQQAIKVRFSSKQMIVRHP
jgi:nitroreductase